MADTQTSAQLRLQRLETWGPWLQPSPVLLVGGPARDGPPGLRGEAAATAPLPELPPTQEASETSEGLPGCSRGPASPLDSPVPRMCPQRPGLSPPDLPAGDGTRAFVSHLGAATPNWPLKDVAETAHLTSAAEAARAGRGGFSSRLIPEGPWPPPLCRGCQGRISRSFHETPDLPDITSPSIEAGILARSHSPPQSSTVYVSLARKSPDEG